MARCVLCGEETPRQQFRFSADAPLLCTRCYGDLFIRHRNLAHCTLCGRFLPLARESQPCSACEEEPPVYSRLISLFSYDFLGRGAVKQVKFEERLDWLPLLIKEAMARGSEYPFIQGITLAAFHPGRRNQRSQPIAQFARKLSRALGVPFFTSLYRRGGLPQKKLNREERLVNLQGRIHLLPHRVSQVKGKRLLLVDDVSTTGATLRECSQVLVCQGASAVFALVWSQDQV